MDSKHQGLEKQKAKRQLSVSAPFLFSNLTSVVHYEHPPRFQTNAMSVFQLLQEYTASILFVPGYKIKLSSLPLRQLQETSYLGLTS
jgi:hypothetical protein